MRALKVLSAQIHDSSASSISIDTLELRMIERIKIYIQMKERIEIQGYDKRERERERERHTDRQTDRQRDRQRQRERDRQTDKQTDKETDRDREREREQIYRQTEGERE